MLCDDLEGWDDGVRGGSKTEGICDIVIHISLIHFVGQQKRIRCKATISNKKKAGACLYTHTHTHTGYLLPCNSKSSWRRRAVKALSDASMIWGL